MFNLFLTFSVADLHEKALHEKLPGSEKYLHKKVVKNLHDIPKGDEPDNYIDERTDFQMRMEIVNENSDIVNAYLIKKVDLLWKHILKPIFGGEHYIKRYEFQHRGTIHCHMVMSVVNGPTCHDMKTASKSVPKMQNINGDEELKAAQELTDQIMSARKKLADFNSHLVGVSAIHPETDP